MMNVDEYKLPLKRLLRSLNLKRFTKQMILIL